MKNLYYFLFVLIVVAFSGCQKSENLGLKENTTADNQVNNPIQQGFYPDPSVCKGPDGYYMVHSTFAYFPGIPVFYSPDLLHWKQIGHVLTRRSQLLIDGQDISTRGTYAPTIEYHDGTFYIACTEVGNRGNYIATSEDPAGPWSDLHFLPQVNGIDPSLFFDDDGKTYIVFNSDPPDNKPLYNGHRTIKMLEVDINAMQTVGEETILVNGGVDITQEPVWIEGPHLFKYNGAYYLSAAEGGTGPAHRQVIFRSGRVNDPFIPWDQNPILTQMHLNPNRENPITSTGHADLIQDLDGEWWAVFLGCRPYEGNHYNLGRETFMAPLKWENGWPRVTSNDEVIKSTYPFPAVMPAPEDYEPLNGNFSKKDEFTSSELDLTWVMIRNSTEQWYELDSVEGKLTMDVRPFSYLTESNPSFLGRRQQHMKGHASTSLTFSPQREDDKAGLVVFQNVGHFYYLCKSVENGQEAVQVLKGEGNGVTKLASVSLQGKGELKLKIESDVDVYRCYFAEGGGEWKQVGNELDARHLSTETAGGFTGCLYGMYAFSAEGVSGLTATYNWFEYEGND